MRVSARIPNLTTQRHYFTAEFYTLWTTLLGPVLLHGRFAKPKYYKHFLQLVDTELRTRIADWVQRFENRLSTCTLTLHALLHFPDDILNAGPMWCYWNYITERFVGYLVRSSKSRTNPYASFARRLREIAQNNAINVKYQLWEVLDLSERREEDSNGHRLTSCESSLLRLRGPLILQVRKAIKNYLLRNFEVSEEQISFTDGGDKIRAAELVAHSEQNMTRDASFIKYSHDVDKNRNRRHQPVLLQREVSYGQLLRIVEVFADLPRAVDGKSERVQQARTMLLAVIRPVKLLAQSQRLGTPYFQDNRFAPIEVIDANDISCQVACVPALGGGPRRWALLIKFSVEFST
ncbi:hypothetical protein C8J57DRAFT_1505209 [Mycena rebaudengoi]|nr:hypothetical protein C8J57DRAFT_1505209 [Mycena rebaudengoi]